MSAGESVPLLMMGYGIRHDKIEYRIGVHIHYARHRLLTHLMQQGVVIGAGGLGIGEVEGYEHVRAHIRQPQHHQQYLHGVSGPVPGREDNRLGQGRATLIHRTDLPLGVELGDNLLPDESAAGVLGGDCGHEGGVRHDLRAVDLTLTRLRTTDRDT